MAEEQTEGFDITSDLNDISAEQFTSPEVTPDPPKSNFGEVMNGIADDAFKTNFAPPAPKSFLDFNKPVAHSEVGYAGPELDLYRFQDDFNSYTFNSNDPTNYERWTAEQSWGDALGKGFDSFASRFGHTFKDYWKGYGRMFNALFSWDSSKLQPGEAQMIEYNWKEHKDMMEDFVFVPPDEDDDIFSKRSVSEFIGNAGFALGTFAGVGIELAADLLITVATAPAAGIPGFAAFGATFGRLGAKFGLKKVGKEAAEEVGEQVLKKGAKKGTTKAGKFLEDLGEGWKLGDTSTDGIRASATDIKMGQADAVKDAGKVGSNPARGMLSELWKTLSLNFDETVKSKSFGEFAQNMAKGIPLVGTGVRYGEKIAVGAKAGLSGGKLTGIGLKGLSRVRQEFNLASTEASFEGVSTYGATLDQMVKNYRARNNGETPPAEELIRMQELSMKASFKNYGTNLSILLATNRLQFGGLFSKFSLANKFGKEIMEDATGEFLNVNRMFKGTQTIGKQYKKGFFGTYGLIGQVSQDFGRKQAVYELGKKLVKDFGKFQVTEGLQENLQETSNSAWTRYYVDQYENASSTLGDAFSEGLGEQWSKQGLKTFLMGALTGGLIHGPTRLFQKGLGAAQKAAMNAQYKDGTQNPYQQHEDQMQRDADLVNAAIASMTSKTKKEDAIFSFSNTVQSTIDQTEAAANNKQYEYQNAYDNMMLNAALAANRSGSIDMFTHALRDAGMEMTAEQFEAQFGTKLSETKYSSPLEFMNDVADDVQKYSNVVDSVRKTAKNLADPFMYEKGTEERMIATMLHNAQEDAIKIIALNKMKAMRADERAESVSKDILSIPGLANSAEHALRVLTNPEMMDSEIGMLGSEIESLKTQLKEGGLTPELKASLEKQLKEKREEKKIYDEWMTYWDDRDVVSKRRDPDTGKVIEKKDKVKNTYVGRKFKRQKRDSKTGRFTKEKEDAWDLHDEKALEAFRKFVNLRNKQAGISTEVSEEELRSGFDKIIDFIRLDQDAKDYMRAVDALYNPDHYRQVLKRMSDGKFKKEVLDWLNMIEGFIIGTSLQITQSVVQENLDQVSEDEFAENLSSLMPKIKERLENTIKKSDAYNTLLGVVVNENLGTEQFKMAYEAYLELETIMNSEIARLNREYFPETFEDVSDEVYTRFKTEEEVDDFTKNIIAEKMFAGEELSPKQIEIYEFFKDEIDKKVQSLKDAVAAKRTRKRTKTKNYDERDVDVTKGRAGTNLFILDTDDRNFDDIIEYYGISDMSTGTLVSVVQKAIASNHTHPYVKEVLKNFLPFINPEHKIEFNSEQTYAPGYYDANNNMIVIDPTIADLGMSFEGILMHEMIHYMTSNELNNAPEGEFAKQVQDLFTHAKETLQATGLDTDFYGFTNIHEFLAEAYSNPEFQAELQKVPSKYGEQSVWQDFLSLLADFLKRAFNINMQESVLDDIFKAVENHIGANPVSFSKRKLVESGQYSTAEVQTMGDQDAISEALKLNLVTPEELSNLTQTKEAVSDEDWKNFNDNQKANDSLKNSIANKNAKKEKLSNREGTIYKAHRQEIDELEKELGSQGNIEGEYSVAYQDGYGWYIEKGGNPITDTTSDDVLAFSTKEEAESYIKTLEEEASEQPPSKEPEEYFPGEENMDDIESMLEEGDNAETTDNLASDKEGQYQIYGDDESGYEVRDSNQSVVIENLPTLNDAEVIVEGLVNDKQNVEFGIQFLSDSEKGLGDFSEDLQLFVSRGKRLLEIHNKGSKTPIATLEEYSKIPKGMRELEAAKKSAILGTTYEDVLEVEKQERNEAIKEGTQLLLFETTTTATGSALTMESIQDLDTRLSSIKAQPKEKVDDEVQEESAKFTEAEQESTEADVTEDSIIQKLKDIHGCQK